MTLEGFAEAVVQNMESVAAPVPGRPGFRLPSVRPASEMHAGTPTSKAAAEKADKHAASKRAVVLQAIVASQDGLTDREIEAVTGFRHETASARRRQLAQECLVRDSGRTRKTPAGLDAVVWEVVPDGERARAHADLEREELLREIRFLSRRLSTAGLRSSVRDISERLVGERK